MLLFLENGIRGGVSYCATRLAERSSKKEDTQELAYLDANNLVRYCLDFFNSVVH